MAARTSSVMPGAGASSMTFWWRRCSEQSRSNRCTTLPWRSPKTCTSIWRGACDVFLQQHAVVAEGGGGLAPAGGQRGVEILGALDPAHALAAAAGHRLDQHRIADAVRLAPASVSAIDPHPDSRASPARRPSCISSLAASFRPIARIAAGGAPDPDQAGGLHRFGEVGILREEAIAGMDRLRAASARAAARIFSRIEIALARRRRTDGESPRRLPRRTGACASASE